jgi:hypothetical protein
VTRRNLVLALMLVVAAVALPGGALAAVATLERAGGATGFTSANKSFNASCPTGKRLLGTGADIGGGSGQVGIAELIPNAALRGMSVRAVEDGDGFGADWSLGGSGLCATPVPGLERVVAASPANSANKGATATCPAGKRLLGTGAAIGGGGGQVVLRELIPNAALTSVSAFGAEDDTGFSGNWSVTAYAVCANPVAGLELVTATSATDSSSDKAAVATCPVSKLVTGVGGRLKGAGGQVFMDDLISFPNPATGVQVVGIEDQSGTGANWSATAYAICANSSQLVTDMSPIDSDFHKEAFAECPAGRLPSGGGGDLTGALGAVTMNTLSAFILENAAFIQSDETQSGTTGDWFVRGFAICATPLPGLQQVEAMSAFNSSLIKNAVVTCPAGKQVVGPGGLAGGSGQVFLDQIVPNASLTSVVAQAQEDQDLTSGNWLVAAEAICADPPPGLQLATARSPSDSNPSKTVTAACPSGKNVLGAGASIASGAGEVVIDDMVPNNLLTNVTATGFEDPDGFAGNWRVFGYAICANP